MTLTYELEHFKEFHDDPASFSDEDFRAKTLEWMIFVAETKGQIDFDSEEWYDIGDRFYDELDARFPLTDELKEEFENLKARFNIEPEDKKYTSEEALRRSEKMEKDLTEFVAFIKRYQVEFQFARHYIALNESNLEDIRERIRKRKNLDLEIKGLEYEYQQAVAELDDSLTEFYDTTGKTPVMTAHKDKKKHSGN